jgi:hypothetical protein
MFLSAKQKKKKKKKKTAKTRESVLTNKAKKPAILVNYSYQQSKKPTETTRKD